MESEAEMKETASVLQRSGFGLLPDVHILGEPGKYYLNAGDYTPNTLYDLLVQYGSGQIYVHSKDTGSSWINPPYAGSSLVLLITKKTLKKIEEEGMLIRSVVGPAFQL